MPETIVVLDPMPEARAEQMRAFLPPGMVLTHGRARGDAHLKEIIAEADYAIAGQVGVSGEVLAAARRLKLLHKWGVGVDNLDLEAARRLGIGVARTPGSNAIAVAELAFGLTLAALRHIAFAHGELREGVWRGPRMPTQAFTLTGKTVGIVGFGAVGRTFAGLLRGFRCPILYAKRTPLPADEEAALGARHADLAAILAGADVVVLCCPLTPETQGMIDAAALARMKPTAVLVNVARGGIVVEDDLAAALETRTILGAAMDVFETEPLPADSPLLAVDTLIVTPHIGAMAADIFEPTVRRMFDNCARVSRGEPVREGDRVV